MFRIIFLLSILTSSMASVSGWAEPKFLGTYYQYSGGMSPTLRIFEIYDVVLPELAVKSLFSQKELEVVSSTDSHSGFVSKGLPLPKRVYFVDPSNLPDGLSKNEIADNVLPLILIDEKTPSGELSKSELALQEALNLGEVSNLEKIRVSCASLIRIQDATGNLILIPNKSTYNQGRGALPAGTIMKAPVGGAFSVIPSVMDQINEDKNFLTKADVRFERSPDETGQVDLRFTMARTALPEFITWFLKRENRETDPLRELGEELVVENTLFGEAEWSEILKQL
jgi:hypothetical protein